MKKFIDESWLVVVLGVVFACLLAGTQTSLKDTIAANETRALREAIAAVIPDLDVAQEPQKLEIDGNIVFKCLAADGSLAGWAVDAQGGGFIDKIRLVVGVSPDGRRVLGIKVVAHLETPGLGNKIDTKGDENFYPRQYEGKATDRPLVLTKRPPTEPHEIQAITGATYSSQYTMDIVNDVLTRVVPQLPRE
jgi:electron transport complex protein RnfG